MEIMFSTILMLCLACGHCTVINVGKSKKETYQSITQELKQWKMIYWKQTKIAILVGQLQLKKFSRENCHWEAGNIYNECLFLNCLFYPCISYHTKYVVLIISSINLHVYLQVVYYIYASHTHTTHLFKWVQGTMLDVIE